MNSCSHPHVLVTGASSGIGRATALRLAVSGYHVFAGVRRPADGTALCQGAGREITPVRLDVTQAGQSVTPPAWWPGTSAVPGWTGW